MRPNAQDIKFAIDAARQKMFYAYALVFRPPVQWLQPDIFFREDAQSLVFGVPCPEKVARPFPKTFVLHQSGIFTFLDDEDVRIKIQEVFVFFAKGAITIPGDEEHGWSKSGMRIMKKQGTQTVYLICWLFCQKHFFCQVLFFCLNQDLQDFSIYRIIKVK